MFRKVVNTLIAQIVGTGASLALGILFARMLGPAGKGVISYAWIILGFALVFGEGTAAAVVSQYARSKMRRDRVHAAALHSLAMTALPVSAALLAVGAFVSGQWPLIAVAVALPGALYTQVVKGLLLAEGRVSQANLIDVSLSAGYAAVAAVFVVAHTGAVGALVVWALSYCLASALATHLLMRAPGRKDATVDAGVRELTRMQLAFGGKSGFVYAAGYLNLRVDMMVVALVLGPAALGVYSVATGTAELLWKVANAVAWSALGRIAGDDDDTVRLLIGKLTRIVVLLEAALAVAAVWAGPWLIAAVYGGRFAAAGRPLQVIMLGIVAYSVEPILGYFLLVRARRPGLILAIQSASAVACAVLTALLLPRFGLTGAAMASTVTYVAVVAVKGWLVAKSIGAPLGDIFVPKLDDVEAIWRRCTVLLASRRAPKTEGAA